LPGIRSRRRSFEMALKGLNRLGHILRMVIIQMGNLKLSILALTLAVSLSATAQENWGPSYDWLSAGTKIYRSPYYFPPSSPYYYSYNYPYDYYPYSMPPGFPDFFLWQGLSAYPPYPAWAEQNPWIGQRQPLSKAWWIGLQQDWMKTLSYARAQSSVLVYRDGTWRSP